MLPDTSTFTLLSSIAKLFSISAAGYLSVRFRLISEHIIRVISKCVIFVTLPCLIIATLGSKLELDMLATLARAAWAALALNIAGLCLALLTRRAFIGSHQRGRTVFLSLSSIQNAGYLPIPLVAAVLPPELRSQGLLITFVYIMVMGAIFWSLGVWLITEGSERDVWKNVKKVLNPPIVAILFGLLFLVPPFKEGFSRMTFLVKSLTVLGSATVPLVMVVLGGSFGSAMTIRQREGRIVTVATIVKLLVIPLLTLIVLRTFTIDHTFGFVLMLEASMPAALNHVVVVRQYGGNVSLTSRALFVQYTVSIFTIPLFLYLFNLKV
jgi:predicted permease